MTLLKRLSFIVVLTTAFVFLSTPSLISQELSIHQGFWKLKFYEDSQEISKRDFENKLGALPEAAKLWSASKSNMIFATVFSAVGGYGLGAWISADRRQSKTPYIAMTAGGLVLGGILTASAANKRRDALLLYNQQFDTGGIRLTPSSSGLGLALHF